MNISLESVLQKLESIRQDVVNIQKQIEVITNHEAHDSELDKMRKEIKFLNHVIDEQDCDIRHLRKKLHYYNHEADANV